MLYNGKKILHFIPGVITLGTEGSDWIAHLDGWRDHPCYPSSATTLPVSCILLTLLCLVSVLCSPAFSLN